MKKFMINTREGIFESEYFEKFTHLGRLCVISEAMDINQEGKEMKFYTVSDYLTGYQIGLDHHKAKAIRIAKSQLEEAERREASGRFKWSNFKNINSDEYKFGLSQTDYLRNLLIATKGDYKSGLIEAIKQLYREVNDAK